MKFSIVVPVYGVEKYLGECVKSLLAQTYTDYEVILVDDCSPDNCPAMCDEFSRQDSRVRVIHHEVNRGLGMSRNTGMAAAKGEYILFVDSDDFIRAETLEECNDHLASGTDLVVFGFTNVHQDAQGATTRTEELTAPAMTALCPEENGEAFIRLNRARIFPFAWNKIYRREFLESFGAAFEKTKLIEDFLFNIQVFSKAKRIDILEKPLYFYRKPAHETLASKYAPEFFDLCKRKYLLEKQFLQDCGADTAENQQVIFSSYIKHFISAAIRNRSAAANLCDSQQIDCIAQMLSDPVTREVLSLYTPDSMKMKVIAFAMRHGMARSCAFVAMCADFAKTHFSALFMKIS
ncbi:MAG: glycosyltransferase family 2 protein [Faecousia sp.]